MQIIRRVSALRTAVAALKTGDKSIALVPTMGALHAGHLALVAAGKDRADHVVASIFVNPKQFGPNEDLDRYPRRETEDVAALEAAGCAIAWLPDATEMYPPCFVTSIGVGGATTILEGAARPGHFDGVATVVAKLFNQVRPDIALFGEKDYQQLAVVRRMAADLNFGIDIVGVPTVRDPDGLALSSRNVYLSAEQRRQALALPQALHDAAAALRRGASARTALAAASNAIVEGGFDSVDYVALHDAETLAPLETLSTPARLLAAARIGGTRLIDNLAVLPD
ncbi:MAG: pantoate--beta-alanine ligase [Sphingomonadaceae bacterium]|nr:pantoate--beta-alanine ligase [Sphingomonadaceae bacterium]